MSHFPLFSFSNDFPEKEKKHALSYAIMVYARINRQPLRYLGSSSHRTVKYRLNICGNPGDCCFILVLAWWLNLLKTSVANWYALELPLSGEDVIRTKRSPSLHTFLWSVLVSSAVEKAIFSCVIFRCFGRKCKFSRPPLSRFERKTGYTYKLSNE